MMQSTANPQRIKRIAESVLSLPTLPTVVSKMIEIVDNPKTSATSLARLISTDQTLTAKILKLANSAYYGLSREVSTVNKAIVVLGFNSVREMGLSLSVLDAFKGGGSSGLFDIAKFWEHSIGCGVASRMLAKAHLPEMAGEAFVAGLLHDIGKVILNQYAHADFEKILQHVAHDNMELEDAELQQLGAHHAEIGSWLAHKWRLPDLIVTCIRHHHNPAEAGTFAAFVAFATIADYLCHKAHVGNSGRRSLPVLTDGFWELFDELHIPLSVDMLDDIEMEFLLEYDQAETFVSFLYEDR
ncbi:MAG: HDOD domain-containing protein [Chitinivibrionales bacterium]|nr:HDOD domain-containing protein [Chitinivibrionales bacterium]